MMGLELKNLKGRERERAWHREGKREKFTTHILSPYIRLKTLSIPFFTLHFKPRERNCEKEKKRRKRQKRDRGIRLRKEREEGRALKVLIKHQGKEI